MIVIRYMTNFVKNMKIRNKLISIYLIVVFIPVLIVGIYLTKSMTNIVINNTIDEASYNTNIVKYRFQEVLKIATDVSDRIYVNESIAGMIKHKYSNYNEIVDAYSANTTIDEYLRSYSELKNIRCYTDNGTMLFNSQFMFASNYVKNQQWYKDAINNNGRITWVYKDDDILGKQVLSLVRCIKDSSGNKLGVLVININDDSLRTIIKDEPYETIITMDKTPIISKSQEDLKIDDYLNEYDLPVQDDNYKFKSNYKHEPSYMIISSFLTEKALIDKFQIIMSIPIELMTKQTTSVVERGIISIVLTIILSLILILYFSKNLSGRINILRNEMHKVSLGDFNIKKSIEGKDEIGELYYDLNIMMESIKQLINEVYVEKINAEQLKNRQKEVQFKMLASQINPHFLYNTLETIRMKAYCNDQIEIANIVKVLGKIMRRNLEVTDKIVSLKSEVDLLENYLSIQKVRFEDKIEYECNIDINIENCQILPLLIQPIVENAFVHGLENKKGKGTIIINIYNKNNCTVIDVIDNGFGIDPEKLVYINNQFTKEDNEVNKSIGLTNVNQRIKLFYGKEYGLNVVSEVDKGTKVIILLPILGRGDEDVKSFDS